MIQSPDLRCRECSTWTPRTDLTHDFCRRCVARFEALGMWCAEHGACWPGGCLGCTTTTNAPLGAVHAEAPQRPADGAAAGSSTECSDGKENLLIATAHAYGLTIILWLGICLAGCVF